MPFINPETYNKIFQISCALTYRHEEAPFEDQIHVEAVFGEPLNSRHSQVGFNLLSVQV